jgi:hypothetical protein
MLQPSVSFPGGELQNVGQYFALRWDIPRSKRWQLFYYFGMNNLWGVSVRVTDGYAITLGAGAHAKRLVDLDEQAGHKTAELVGTAGVFVDRDNSLLVSLVYSGAHESMLAANIYPGVITAGSISPGFWTQVSRDGVVLAGISLRWLPGISVRMGHR